MNELFIGGGGFDGFKFLGVLEYIHKNELLDLKTIYGCSIGAYISVMYALFRNPTRILEYMLSLDPKEIARIDIRNITKTYSILDSGVLDALLEGLELADETTLQDFYKKTDIHVNIYVTNVDRNEYQILNDTLTPNIKLKDAIKASMSIPFLFPPVIINDETYIDGCCKNLYGSPPNEHYILGYSIIGKIVKGSHYANLLHTLINNKEPEGSFIIRCNKTDNFSKYADMNNINRLELIEMYSQGVVEAREQLL